MKKVETPDAATISFDLSGSNDRELPLTLALMPALSKARTDAERFNETSLDIPLGSGPYKVTKWTPGTEVIFERNETWACGPKPKIPRIIWRMVPSAGNRRALLERGSPGTKHVFGVVVALAAIVQVTISKRYEVQR